jgi:hypothetical protein
MEQGKTEDAGISLTDVDILEFIEIYKQEFKEDLSPRAAREMATGVLELYRLLAKPLPDEKKAPESPDFTPPDPKS